MTTPEQITKIQINKFRKELQQAIDVRDAVLYPKTTLYTISQSIQDQDITMKEEALLKCVLALFDKVFGVE